MLNERPYWFFQADTFGEHIRWGVISMACVLSGSGLALLGLAPLYLVGALLLPASLGTLLVNGPARKLHIVYVTVFLSGWFGIAIVVTLWWNSASENIEFVRRPTSLLPLYLAYLLIAALIHRKVKVLRSQEEAGR